MSIGNSGWLAYLEFEIDRCNKRIQKIKENPDPSKPKSNILLYELERELRMEQLEAYKAGKPFGLATQTGPLTRSLGMVPWDAVPAADRTYGEAATRYFDIIRKEGMPEHTCDRCSILIPMVLRGDFPKPSFLATTNYECIPILMANLIIANILDIPTFHFDRHFKNYKAKDKEDDEQLGYITEQLGEMIEYVEANVPGCKYNEDMEIEWQYYERQYILEAQKLWKLKAAIPCPLSGRESFREFRPSSLYPNPAKAVEYMRQYVEEVGERVDKGIGVAQPEERLRLLWSVAGPFYSDPFDYLEHMGVSIPAAEMTIYNGWFSGRESIWGDPWKGRKLTPLEEEARQVDFVWGRTADSWVQTHINTCQDLHIDGIIYFLQWGCPVTNNLGKIIEDTAEQQLGIPTLLIEGRMLESSIYDEKDFNMRLKDFVDICLDRKKNRIGYVGR